MVIERPDGQTDQGLKGLIRGAGDSHGNTNHHMEGGFSLYDAHSIREFLRREEQAEQDVPLHESGSTSSVGALWPAQEASFERIKGIYTPSIVTGDEQMQDILNTIAEAALAFGRGDVTRVSLRAVVDRKFLDDSIRSDPGIDDLIEAQFSLAGTNPAFERSLLVYFGINHASRQPLPKEIERYVDNVEKALEHDQLTPQQILDRARSQGYSITILSEAPTNEVIDQITLLYERFGWSRTEVVEILTKPENIIAVASIDSQTVSAGIAEMAQIPIGKNTLRIVEITEAATREDHSRKGLYTAVSTSLLLDLAQRSRSEGVLGGEIDIVYGECNGNAPGVLKTARIQGRRFAFEDGPRGILFQHVPIAGLPKETRYNDLFPAYIGRKSLYERYAPEST